LEANESSDDTSKRGTDEFSSFSKKGAAQLRGAEIYRHERIKARGKGFSTRNVGRKKNPAGSWEMC